MNSAKRISNKSVKTETKTNNEINEGVDKKKGLIIAGVGALAVLILVIAVLWENLHPKLIFTINGNKVYLDDMMVDIYMNEATGEYMNQLYQQNYGSSYWDIVNDDGYTNAELVKDNCIDSVMQKYMMYYEAVEAGLTLTDEENTEAEANATQAYEQLTADVKNKTGLTKQDFVDYNKMSILAGNYKNAWIDSFDIDDAALTAGISKEDFRQYEIQYYYIPYTTTDESGNSVDMDDSQKKTAIAELEASYDDILSLTDFSTYISTSSSSSADASATPTPAPEVTAPEGTNIKYSSKKFIESDEAGSIGFDEELVKTIKAMNNNDVSESVVEDSKGCYIIKMVNNNSTERYETECENVITKAEEERFSEEIDNLEVEKYYIELKDNEWDRVEFGKVTIN